MGWYRVVKTVRGRRYLYEQRSWREGEKVRTQSRYIGPAGGVEVGATRIGGSRSAITTPISFSWGAFSSFGKAMLNQFDVRRWGIVAGSQLGLINQKRKTLRSKRNIAKKRLLYPCNVTVKHVAINYDIILAYEHRHYSIEASEYHVEWFSG
jgi:hypothetical protein